MLGILSLIKQDNGIFFEAILPQEDLGGIQSGYIFKRIEQPLLKMDSIFNRKNRAERFAKRFEAGHLCYGFFDQDNRVASYIWITIPDSSDMFVPLALQMQMSIKTGTAYIWDCFTKEEYRRQGLYKYGLIHATNICLKVGAKRVLIYSRKNNLASKNGILSAGFKKIFDFSLLRLGPFYFIRKNKTRLVVTRKKYFDLIGE
jgi:hypothetical protein